MQSINKRGTMTKRDEYIIRNRAQASAFLTASFRVPADVTARGGNVRSDLRAWANAAQDNANWAMSLTNREFNAIPHKP